MKQHLCSFVMKYEMEIQHQNVKLLNSFWDTLYTLLEINYPHGSYKDTNTPLGLFQGHEKPMVSHNIFHLIEKP